MTYRSPERSYGSLCERTRHLSTKEIAAHVRKTVRQLAKDGLIPSEWTYSVRYESYSGGSSIRVKIVVPDAIVDRIDAYEAENRHRYTTFLDTLGPEFDDVRLLHRTRVLLEETLGAYNYDGSDSMVDYFDVRFYGFVDFERISWHERFK